MLIIISSLALLIALNIYLIRSSTLTLYSLLLMNSLFTALYIMYFVRIFSNLTNYVFTTLILAFLFSWYVLSNETLKTYGQLFQGGTFLVIFLLVLTTITIFGLIRSFDYYNKIANIQPPRGDKGYTGPIGNSGETLDNDLNMCSNQAIEKVEQLMRKYKEPNSYDPKLLLFNNLYMKRQINRICKSSKYMQLKKEYGSHYSPVQIVNNDIEKAIKHLLKYNNGMKFLEDHFFTKYHWNNDLLSKNPSHSETQNPFDYIETLDIWSWK
jgi:hypothetical protein